MRFALFVGCAIPARLPELESSARAVLGSFGVTLVDLPFGCCGYPARRYSADDHLVLAARNLAMASARGLPILTLCQCCYGSLRHARAALLENPASFSAVVRILAREGLEAGTPEVRHVLDVLGRDIGPDAIRERVTAPLDGVAIAPHYGCHALRPSDVVDLDNPHAPSLFERLLEAVGAQPVDWPRRLECCGAPLEAANPGIGRRMRDAKIADARESGATVLATACPHCQEQFGGSVRPRAVSYTQLLGLALGIPARRLGLGDGRL